MCMLACFLSFLFIVKNDIVSMTWLYLYLHTIDSHWSLPSLAISRESSVFSNPILSSHNAFELQDCNPSQGDFLLKAMSLPVHVACTCCLYMLLVHVARFIWNSQSPKPVEFSTHSKSTCINNRPIFNVKLLHAVLIVNTFNLISPASDEKVSSVVIFVQIAE